MITITIDPSRIPPPVRKNAQMNSWRGSSIGGFHRGLTELLSALLVTVVVSCGPGVGNRDENGDENGDENVAKPAPRTVDPDFNSDGKIVMEPLYRFVDPDLVPRDERHRRSGPSPVSGAGGSSKPDVGTTGYSSASILDETRFTLAAPTRGFLVQRKPVTVGPDGHVRLTPALVPRFAETRQVVAVPRVKMEKGWSKLPPRIVKPEKSGQAWTVRLDFEVPKEIAAEVSEVSVEGFGVDPAGLSPLGTTEVHIPEGAQLEFAVGILEPAWAQGPVDFRLLSCEANDCDLLFSERIDPSIESQRGWQERRISLDDLAGKTRAFVFEAKPRLKKKGFSFPVWANPTLYAPKARQDGDVNVILLSIDTLRASNLTSYGYRHDTAPFIEERFAKGGVVFDNCVAAATTTSPSHMSMFTSLQPATHGLKSGREALSPNIRTLPELIRARRIETGAVTEDGWLGIRHGFGRGFNTYSENKSPNIMVPTGQVDRTFGRAKAWLEWNRHKRFFLFLHTFQVHAPYWPPGKYRPLFSEFDGGTIDASSPRYLRDLANYDREIRYTDDELRLLFKTIDSLGLSGNTVFILTSDHGEEFLEHGMLSHGAHMYEEAVHVPLMFWGRNIPSGKRIELPVSHVDFMPTILDMFQITPPDYAFGVSLMPLVEGATNLERFAGRALFSESHGLALGENNKPLPFSPPAYSVRKGSRKFSRYRAGEGHRYEYYDLSSDPLERDNLYSDKKHAGGELRVLLDTYEALCANRREEIDALVGRPVIPALPEKAYLDPEQEEKLRALGYIE